MKNCTVVDDTSQVTVVAGCSWRDGTEALIFRGAMFTRDGAQMTEVVVAREEAKRLGEWIVAWAKEHEPKPETK